MMNPGGGLCFSPIFQGQFVSVFKRSSALPDSRIWSDSPSSLTEKDSDQNSEIQPYSGVAIGKASVSQVEWMGFWGWPKSWNRQRMGSGWHWVRLQIFRWSEDEQLCLPQCNGDIGWGHTRQVSVESLLCRVSCGSSQSIQPLRVCFSICKSGSLMLASHVTVRNFLTQNLPFCILSWVGLREYYHVPLTLLWDFHCMEELILPLSLKTLIHYL